MRLEKKPLLSMLTPSRERADALKFSLDSLGLEKNNIEVLVWVDDDDPQIDKYNKLFAANKHIQLFVKPQVGYIKAHEMYNFLSSEAKGDWLMLWNDDAYMERIEWYDTFIDYASLSKPLEEPVVYNIWRSDKDQNVFPIVSRKYYEILGHFAGHTVCDVWIKAVGTKSHIQRYIPGIKPRHRKYGLDDDGFGDLVDNTHKSTMSLYENSRYLGVNSPPAIKGMAEDVTKIVDWIKDNKNRDLRVGFVGLGKLGLPVALAMEFRGKNIVAYDVNPEVSRYIDRKQIPFQEHLAGKFLPDTKIETVDSVETLVRKCNLVFCAVQTPHDSRFEGNQPLKDEPVDFDYTYLKQAVKDVVAAADKLNEPTTLVVISTCLPGTYKREIKPLLSSKINYVYNPYFIAMGTVIDNFLYPELTLIGNDTGDITPLINFYKMIIGEHSIFVTDITTAEGIKVFYNTYITAKTVLGNIYGELAHKIGMNVDHIHQALSLATDRLISPKYLRSGVGDGGGCHPRDNIALSHLAKKFDLSFNIFDALMAAREDHMSWLASIAKEESETTGLPVVILGKAFKPGTNIQTGSPAVLMANLLSHQNLNFDQWEFDYPSEMPVAVYFLATQHPQYKDLIFPKGSTVIDPFRYVKHTDGVRYIPIGLNVE